MGIQNGGRNFTPPPPPFNLAPTLMHSHAHKQKSVQVIDNIIQKYISFTFD